VGANAERIRASAELVFGRGDFEVVGADREAGAFFGPMLMACADPFRVTSRTTSRRSGR
jgi:hypothetical protein